MVSSVRSNRLATSSSLVKGAAAHDAMTIQPPAAKLTEQDAELSVLPRLASCRNASRRKLSRKDILSEGAWSNPNFGATVATVGVQFTAIPRRSC